MEKKEEVDTYMINKTTGISAEELRNLSENIPQMTWDQAADHAGYIENEIGRILKAYKNTH